MTWQEDCQAALDRTLDIVTALLLKHGISSHEEYKRYRAVTFAAERLAYYLKRLDDPGDHKLAYTRVCLQTAEVREYVVQPYMATHKLIYETRAYCAKQTMQEALRQLEETCTS